MLQTNHELENWQLAEFPLKKAILGTYCVLEPLNLRLHAAMLFEALRYDDASWAYLPYGPFETFEAFHEWLSSQAKKTDPQFYVIIDLNTQRALGLASYMRITPEHGVIEVGHLHFSHLLKRTVLATEAMYLMMYRVFEELGYRRYEWKCNALNLASRGAAERLGFVFEGIFRQDRVFKKRSRDTAWYSILDSEWPAIRARLEKWLKKENFDNQGRQILRLNEL